MSFSLHCFEGLSIRRCVLDFGACCRKRGRADDEEGEDDKERRPKRGKRKRNNPGRVVMIHDTALDLCVVSAPNRHLETLGTEEAGQGPRSWDFLSVDKDMRLVMLVGDRFNDLSGDPELMSAADGCMGKNISDVFSKPVLDILIPLIDMTLEGKSPQLHTIFRSQSLTLFAYPLMNESRNVIGAHVIYRPTTYGKSDIANIIKRASAAAGR